MKKTLLILSVLLMSVMRVNAADWQVIDTNIPNFNLYIDADSIKSVKGQQYVYAIKYNYTNKPEKVVYVKSDLSNNHIGVIEAGDFEMDSYAPNIVLTNAHVFMKPINDDSFLTLAHKYLTTMSGTNSETADNSYVESPVSKKGPIPTKFTDNSKEQTTNNYTKDVVYKSISPVPQENLSSLNMKEYVSSVCKYLDKNWNPPVSGRKTQAIVIVTVGADGALYKYNFAKSSGDEANDRSIVSAIEQTVPFPKFSNSKKTKVFNFQFVFEYGILRKSVI